MRHLHVGHGKRPNRIFNIEWRTVLSWDETAPQNFEVRLYENDPNGRFDVVLGTLTASTPVGLGRPGKRQPRILHRGLLHLLA